MPVIQDLPDLTHWKTVQEFNIEQAALLLAGIDPYEYIDGLSEVRNRNHERWKLAWGFADGMVTAIRRGTLTPIVCMSEEKIWNDWEKENVTYYETLKPMDRSKNISKVRTIITRDSLFFWIESECVDIVRKPAHINIKKSTPSWNADQENAVIDVIPEHATEEAFLLPRYEHKCEGLDFVEDAIKQFWSTYDEADPATAPTKPEIIEYLKRKGASTNLAEAVDLVLRPFAVRKVGRRKSTKS